MENIETAILLMVVGMATVFVILLIVIYLGKFLITLVNKYAPEEVLPAKKETQKGPAPIPGNILAAISAAVNVVGKDALRFDNFFTKLCFFPKSFLSLH